MVRQSDHVQINMIVVVQMDIVVQVKNSVILLMAVNLYMAYVDVVTMKRINVQIITVVVQKATVVPLMHSAPLIKDVNLNLVIV